MLAKGLTIIYTSFFPPPPPFLPGGGQSACVIISCNSRSTGQRPGALHFLCCALFSFSFHPLFRMKCHWRRTDGWLETVEDWGVGWLKETPAKPPVISASSRTPAPGYCSNCVGRNLKTKWQQQHCRNPPEVRPQLISNPPTDYTWSGICLYEVFVNIIWHRTWQAGCWKGLIQWTHYTHH